MRVIPQNVVVKMSSDRHYFKEISTHKCLQFIVEYETTVVLIQYTHVCHSNALNIKRFWSVR
jgi:hypothetical protein